MRNEDVRTLTGHAIADVPLRNALAQPSEITNVCMQEAQTTWAPRFHNNESVTTQMSQGTGIKTIEKYGGQPTAARDYSQSASKCGGLPSIELFGESSHDYDKAQFSERDLKLMLSKQNVSDYDYKNGFGDIKQKQESGGIMDFLRRQFGKNKEEIQSSHPGSWMNGGKCGTDDRGITSHLSSRRMTDAERIVEQKLIEQKLREIKLRERFNF